MNKHTLFAALLAVSTAAVSASADDSHRARERAPAQRPPQRRGGPPPPAARPQPLRVRRRCSSRRSTPTSSTSIGGGSSSSTTSATCSRSASSACRLDASTPSLVDKHRTRRSRRVHDADMTREPSQERVHRCTSTRCRSTAPAYISLTPWYGKLAAFSPAYVAFDFYFQAGVSFAQLKSNCPTHGLHGPGARPAAPGPDGRRDAAAGQQSEQRPAAQQRQPRRPLPRRRHPRVPERLPRARPDGPRLRVLGQPVGRRLQRGPLRRQERPTGDDDNRFLHHLFFGAGVSIMFPTTVKRTP